MTQTEIQLKENDVYSFRYNDEAKAKIPYPYHCFDGQLIVQKLSSGGFILKDTYWGGSNDCKWFTLEDALKQGELKLKCNLSEVEKISEHQLCYYADKDIFDLSHQHGCYKDYKVRKGAPRSSEKMLRVIQQQIEDAIYRKGAAERELVRLSEKLEKVQAGDLTVTI